jgi:hypothetical protein
MMFIHLDKILKRLAIRGRIVFHKRSLVIAKLIGDKLFMKPFYHSKMITLLLKAKKNVKLVIMNFFIFSKKHCTIKL